MLVTGLGVSIPIGLPSQSTAHRFTLEWNNSLSNPLGRANSILTYELNISGVCFVLRSSWDCDFFSLSALGIVSLLLTLLNLSKNSGSCSCKYSRFYLGTSTMLANLLFLSRRLERISSKLLSCKRYSSVVCLTSARRLTLLHQMTFPETVRIQYDINCPTLWETPIHLQILSSPNPVMAQYAT